MYVCVCVCVCGVYVCVCVVCMCVCVGCVCVFVCVCGVRVCVALLIGDSKHMSLIILPSVACAILQYFFHIVSQTAQFSGGGG